jgi:RNA recognition motif-containing protein
MEVEMNIYVGHLSREATAEDLRSAFEKFGQVADAQVIIDRVTGISRGFGFVEMPNEAEAHAAIKSLDGKDLKGQQILVNKARPRGITGFHRRV